jgi:PTH1 family peptidyl-tRNA hydrolase
VSKHPPIELIVGLGNPGPGYAETRHNVGFWFADRVCELHHACVRFDARFRGELARVSLAGRKFLLLKPMGYMNRSGLCTAEVARYYRIPPQALLVIHDDLDLPPGVARLKESGGPGGHNGLRDLITHLGDDGFVRLRLGIGHPGARELVTPYVLSRPPGDERDAIQSALEAGLTVLPFVIEGELGAAMNQLHRRARPARAEAGDGL